MFIYCSIIENNIGVNPSKLKTQSPIYEADYDW